MRILMIEDDADTAEIVCSEFREHGYDIVHESDGREGLRRAMGEAWDVIIADRTLPGMEGLSIVKTLRAAGNATPILVLSALGNVVDRVDGLQAGGDDYLPKPYAFVELLAREVFVVDLDYDGAGGIGEFVTLTGDLADDPAFQQYRRIYCRLAGGSHGGDDSRIRLPSARNARAGKLGLGHEGHGQHANK